MKKYIKSAVTPWENEIPEIQLEMARTSSDTDLLAQMINSQSVWGLEVASNPNLTDELAHMIFKKHGLMASIALASNPNTPPDILQEIASITSVGRVLEKVAKNPNTPVDVLRALADSDYVEIRGAAMRTLKKLGVG